MKKIILASNSPRRKEILENLNIKFDVLSPDTDESSVDKMLPPELYVENLASLKAFAAAKETVLEKIIIGADTVVALDDKILLKPKDDDDAFNMLKGLSGRAHSVYTGICVVNSHTAKSCIAYEKTDVYFRNLDDDEITRYIQTGESADKAGAYGIQGLGSLFIEKINGDYFNVVGLPVCKLAKILKDEFCTPVL